MKALYISSESNGDPIAQKPKGLAGSSPKRIKELDGLRGIAILLVLSFHYINNQMVNRTDTLSKAITKATSFGWVGVDLFFVLSGFLIGSILIANKLKDNYFRTFYIRRFVRIVPNYFLLLIVFLVIWNIPYFQSNYFLSGKQEIPFWSYFLMIHNFFMANYETLGNDTLSITWSIGIEEQFYLLFPFLIYFLDKKWIPWLLGTLVFVAIGFRSLFDHWIPRYVLLPARMDGLAIGFLIGYLNQTGLLDKHRKQILTASMFIFPVILVTCAFLYWKYGDLGVGKHTLFAIVFGIMIIYALKLSRSWYGSLLRNKALMWIGTISYSLYLFHYLMLVLVFHFAGYTGTGIFGIKEVILVIVAFISSLIISWLIYRLLEQPMVKIGKRFTY